MVEMKQLVVDPQDTKALLFDLDGTLVDTEPLHHEAWVRTFQNQGIEYVDYQQHLKRYASRGRLEIMREEVERHGIEFDFDRAFGDRVSLYHTVMEERGVPLIKGARNLLTRSKGLGLKLALVTGSHEAEVRGMLKLSGLPSGLFDTIVHGDGVANNKPHPEPYLKALDRLGATKEESLVFEDGMSGIRSAVAAGIRCIVVNGYHDMDTLLSISKDLIVIKSLDQVVFDIQ